MRIASFTLVLALTALGLRPAAHAAETAKGSTSTLPISTCQNQPDGQPSCPSGYRCTCVPSCPTCRDCAAQVCVPESTKQCRTACDCPPGLLCDSAGRCSAGLAPVFCCESDRCPIGQQCQHNDGRPDRCGQQCQTACDCAPGLGCFDGRCIAGIASVFCCEGDQCPVGQLCQHRDGRQDRCGPGCVAQAWRCDNPGGSCAQGRTCACTASCPTCEDCGPGVCLPHGTASHYQCNADGSCSVPGDRCLCVSSCPECDDCALSVCVPGCDAMCDRRQRISSKRIDHIIELSAAQCQSDADCIQVDSSSACRKTCGAWVNRKYAQRAKRLVDYLDQRYCTTYASDGCAVQPAACAEQRGACIDGVCRAASAQ